MNGGWVVEVDIKQFEGTLDHTHLREILSKRIHDGVITRLVGKWLNAGVMEEGAVRSPESGTPQGGVISTARTAHAATNVASTWSTWILANVYLHEVLDTWFYREVEPRLEGQAFLIRYADDFVIAFSHERDARRVLDVLPKRFGKYGLALHEGKTGLVRFTRPKPDSDDHEGGNRSATFDFLGFTHYWAKSERGRLVVKQRTASDRNGQNTSPNIAMVQRAKARAPR